MPQILRYPWDTLAITLSNVANTVTAVVFPQGTKRVSLYALTTAGKMSWDETDQGTISAHFFPLAADVVEEVVLTDNQMSNLIRASGKVTIATNPADGEQYHLTVGGTEVIFEFDDGGGAAAGTTAVLIGGNAAATATALAAAISASALSAEADRNLRNTSVVDIATKTDVQMSHTTTAPTKLTLGDVSTYQPVLYLASATASQVIYVECEGE